MHTQAHRVYEERWEGKRIRKSQYDKKRVTIEAREGRVITGCCIDWQGKRKKQKQKKQDF